MYNEKLMLEFLTYLDEIEVNGFDKVKNAIINKFDLADDGHTYYNDDLAVRFSNVEASKGNCVVGVKKIEKYNDRPFLNVQIGEKNIDTYLINLSCIDNATHSSAKAMAVDNFIGTILIKDIMKNIDVNGTTISNESGNFQQLFAFHCKQSLSANKERIATNRMLLNKQIEEKHANGKGVKRFEPTDSQLKMIHQSVERAVDYWKSGKYSEIENELNKRVKEVKDCILKASEIANKRRGNTIEYLITSEPDDETFIELKKALLAGEKLPRIKTKNDLGDYHAKQGTFKVEVDIKTHLASANSSAPKGYSADKVLEFLSDDKTVFMCFFVEIDKAAQSVNCRLVPMFQNYLCGEIYTHCSGVGRRGEVQFQKRQIDKLFVLDQIEIDEKTANIFLSDVLLADKKAS